jgi:hypothetical protein
MPSHAGTAAPLPSERLQEGARELCPLLDRLGRALADLSPHVFELAEPGARAAQQALGHSQRQAEASFQSLEARLLASLRDRPPSPPPLRSYRAPINAQSARLASSHGMLADTGGEALAFLSRSQPQPPLQLPQLPQQQALGRAGSAPLVDIHIAILSASPLQLQGQPELSLSRPELSAGTSSSSLSQAMSQLTSSLAQRTQELAQRTAAISQLSSALTHALSSSAQDLPEQQQQEEEGREEEEEGREEEEQEKEEEMPGLEDLEPVSLASSR